LIEGGRGNHRGKKASKEGGKCKDLPEAFLQKGGDEKETDAEVNEQGGK